MPVNNKERRNRNNTTTELETTNQATFIHIKTVHVKKGGETTLAMGLSPGERSRQIQATKAEPVAELERLKRRNK